MLFRSLPGREIRLYHGYLNGARRRQLFTELAEADAPTRFATDSVVRSWYTFTAYPTPKLMADTLPRYNQNGLSHPALQVPVDERMTARLKWGVNPKRKIGAVTPGAGAPIDYSYYHRLYVSLQNLTVDGKPGTRVTQRDRKSVV